MFLFCLNQTFKAGLKPNTWNQNVMFEQSCKSFSLTSGLNFGRHKQPERKLTQNQREADLMAESPQDPTSLFPSTNFYRLGYFGQKQMAPLAPLVEIGLMPLPGEPYFAKGTPMVGARKGSQKDKRILEVPIWRPPIYCLLVFEFPLGLVASPTDTHICHQKLSE